MQLLTFKIFCDLVETRSFSQSAAKNQITQSAVSQQIRLLEKKYGVTFFERGGKRFSITPEGEAFAAAAKDILDTYDSIGPRLQRLRSDVGGALRISALYSIGLYELPAVVSKFKEAHPGVEVQVEYRRSAAVYEDIATGRADIGLVSFPAPGKELLTQVFDVDQMVLICAPEHRLAKRKRVKLREVNGEAFVVYLGDAPAKKTIEQEMHKHHVKFSQQHEFETIETVIRAVEVTNMISIVPSSTVEKEIRENRIVALKVEDCNLQRPLGMLRKDAENTSPALREFTRLLMRGNM